MRISHIPYLLYFRHYLKRHPDQVKSLSGPTALSPTRILVIANTALGDTLLCTPAIRSLRLSFPESRIFALIKKPYIPLFENWDALDGIIPYHGGYKKFFKTLDAIRNFSPDTVLILHGNGPQDIQLAFLSGAHYILKHPTNSPLKHLLSIQIEPRPIHAIENRLEPVRMIGAKKIVTKMEMGQIGDDTVQRFDSFKEAIGLQVGAADKYKQWPIDRFAALVKKIHKTNPNQHVVITGTREEDHLARYIIKQIPHLNITNMCGKTSIIELAALVGQLKLLVTNDTGTMHLAIARGTPTVSLFSATDSRTIGPYQDLDIHKVIQKNGNFVQQLPKAKRDDKAMRLINVDDVYSVVKEYL